MGLFLFPAFWPTDQFVCEDITTYIRYFPLWISRRDFLLSGGFTWAQKIFLKKFQKVCRFSASKVAVRDCGAKPRDALWQLNIHSSGTFLVLRETSSRAYKCAMPLFKASDKTHVVEAELLSVVAMTSTGVNDTSLRRRRRTRRGWDSHGLVSQTSAWCIPCAWGVVDK